LGSDSEGSQLKPDKPSRTAIATAAARAAHLRIYEGAPIHTDDFALQLIGIADPAQLREALQRWGTPSPARVCAYFALRQRFSEDKLQLAVERGVRQAVLLGAGLDSLALRRPSLAQEITLVEVDHPESQRWKLARLEELQLSTPGVIYVPVDFGCENLRQRLVESGIKLDQPTFFSWLGVTQYIDRTANDATLSFIASQPPESEVVFTFIVKNDLLAAPDRAFSEAAANQSAARGEPWITYFDPTELEEHVADLGFTALERLTPQLAASRYYAGQPADVTPLQGWQIVWARV
jgi:methyltransferase (TIGR00027 family)